MKNFEQSIESKRFMSVVDDLIKKRIVTSDADFCRKIDYAKQSFSQLRKEKINVSIDLVSKLLTIFDANPVFILSGVGEKFIGLNNTIGETPRSTDDGKQTNVIVAELLAQNETLRKVIDLHVSNAKISNEYIAELKEQLNKLKENARKESSG
ncbi:MAG TPA: hypothetical protein VL728_19585 [Cyclobacteriaceae bacterium]|jgi:hypothetical protein|nr:hypothetical protein [Cyclobacteriaceae bacterium]